MMGDCRACAAPETEEILSLGPQSVCNRYLKDAQEREFSQKLALCQCGACGLVQLGETMPVAEIVPRFDWISYREPENHLDGLAQTLSRLPGFTRKSVIAAVTVKDDSLVDRLDKLGFKNHWRLEPRVDLEIEEACAGLETIQERLTVGRAGKIASVRGKADLLIVRHVLEHAYRTGDFIAALKGLVNAGGYIVFEVPDNARCFDQRDYGALWEEHVLYFTRETFKNFFSRAGLDLHSFESYPYPMEDSLVGIARPAANGKPAVLLGDIKVKEFRRARAYAQGLAETGVKFRGILGEYPRGKTALFGAGHRSAMLVNLLGLKDLLGFVVDDDPDKKGLLMPGSRLPILGSAALLERGVELCLLNMSPESEEKVVAKNRSFLEAGGTFASVFPESRYALGKSGRVRRVA